MIKIPKYTDEPPQILFLSLEEFIFIILFSTIGAMVNLLFPGMLLGYGMGRIFNKLQEGSMPGLLYHMMWWVGLVTFKGKVSTGLIREIYE